jgi:rhodanese-related sulfurtransferase
MRNQLLLGILLLFAHTATGQFRYDNIAFRTVYINDLCDSLKKYPDRLILDVRSRGEFADTSSFTNLNIGRLKGAVNIDVNEVKNRLSEIRNYKDKPVFVICSHSQRSRVCSKMLADSGFTQVINVNGAMTEFNLIKNTAVPCVADLYETANSFTLLAPFQVANLLSSGKNVFILDVRTDSSFRGISRDPALNALGRLKGAVNIPLAQLVLSPDKVPTNVPVLVVAEYGRETNFAAKLLTSKGYTNVHAAFNGMFEWASASVKDVPQKNRLWEHTNKFSFINGAEFDEMLTTQPGTYILDVRTADEFNNNVRDRTFLNRGHIQNAVNIPVAELASKLDGLQSYKNRDIVVYTFSTGPESFQAARTLADNGFTRVYLLSGGLFNLRAKAANTKGLSRLMKWVVDVPEENR